MNKFFVVGEWFRMMRKFEGFESKVGDAREYKRAGGKKRNPQKKWISLLCSHSKAFFFLLIKSSKIFSRSMKLGKILSGLLEV